MWKKYMEWNKKVLDEYVEYFEYSYDLAVNKYNPYVIRDCIAGSIGMILIFKWSFQLLWKIIKWVFKKED